MRYLVWIPTLILVNLKLMGLISWSWWIIVFFPIIFSFVLAFIIMVVLTVLIEEQIDDMLDSDDES